MSIMSRLFALVFRLPAAESYDITVKRDIKADVAIRWLLKRFSLMAAMALPGKSSLS
jgi:hypothetical protein